MPDLFSLEDLAAHLQTDLDTASATRYRTAATRRVQGEVGHPIFLTEDDETTLTVPPHQRVIRLPHWPVVDVTTVEAAGLAVLGMRWDRLGYGYLTSWLGWSGAQLRIVYTHGYADADIPGELREVALEVAGWLYENPTALQTETSPTGFAANYGQRGWLTEDQRAICARYQ